MTYIPLLIAPAFAIAIATLLFATLGSTAFRKNRLQEKMCDLRPGRGSATLLKLEYDLKYYGVPCLLYDYTAI